MRFEKKLRKKIKKFNRSESRDRDKFPLKKKKIEFIIHSENFSRSLSFESYSLAVETKYHLHRDPCNHNLDFQYLIFHLKTKVV
ncbi:hypothetical protein BpHYR1_025710 [Brachionus plicatilis]|uniref:Uncharacterized protein n=1 Tax=Brachionus plicatilis TaxID=10195 RepID=A0A3M7REW9_BRAPC|nr:hypothetical protein BpHYR1_025710 [Brachionus plicatilis]